MSTEPESFVARWSRLKRAAERDAVRPADKSAQELPSGPAQDAARVADGAAPLAAPASQQETAPAKELPLPPIESLDGLRSDYQAFFQQPVDDDLRHAALRKLFADPHFNEMDMLDVYVDDYTQFEPLPAELRLRLPSARSFLLDSERAALEAAEARPGDALQLPVVDAGAGCEIAAAPGAPAAACGAAGTAGSMDSTSRRPTDSPELSAERAAAPLSSPSARRGPAVESDPSSS